MAQDKTPAAPATDLFAAVRQYSNAPPDTPIGQLCNYEPARSFMAGAAWAATQRLSPAELAQLAALIEKAKGGGE